MGGGTLAPSRGHLMAAAGTLPKERGWAPGPFAPARLPYKCSFRHTGVVSRLQKRQSQMKLYWGVSGSQTHLRILSFCRPDIGALVPSPDCRPDIGALAPSPCRVGHRKDPTRGLLGTPPAPRPWEGPLAPSSLPDGVWTRVPLSQPPPRKKTAEEKGHRNPHRSLVTCTALMTS